jgi:hypothetical protein
MDPDIDDDGAACAACAASTHRTEFSVMLAALYSTVLGTTVIYSMGMREPRGSIVQLWQHRLWGRSAAYLPLHEALRLLAVVEGN